MSRPIRTLALAGAAVALLAGPLTASAQEAYLKGGLPGVGGGIGFGIGDSFAVRGDFSTMGSRTSTGVREGVDFDAKLKADMFGVYGDWFPQRGGFRLTAGLSSNSISFTGNARPSGNGTITVNNTTVPFSGADAYSVDVKYSPVTPYLGIGWGHNPLVRGLSFVADLGVHFGKFTASSNASPSLVAKLQAAGVNAQAEIDAQTKKVQDSVDKVSVLPVLTVGVAYRW